jgi:cobyric acid synthase CobQ/L-threonine-O-3-phosphate decarboxylase
MGTTQLQLSETGAVRSAKFDIATPEEWRGIHGGDRAALAARSGRRPAEILDFSASINPLGPPGCLRQVILRQLDEIVHYPDPAGRELTTALAEAHGLAPETIVLGNGASELLFALPRAFACARAFIPCPGYVDYETAVRLAGLAVEYMHLRPERGFAPDWQELSRRLRPGDLVFFGHPNNPTATLLDREPLRALAASHPQAIFVVDESFIDFCADPAAVSLLGRDQQANLVVVRSMTKFYAIPGLRLAFAAAAAAVAGRLRAQLPPWSVNTLAQAVGTAVLQDAEYGPRSRAKVGKLRQGLTAALAAFTQIRVFPAAANFLLARLDHPELDARGLADRLLAEEGIAIRVCANCHGLDRRYFRVAVRTAAENERLITALAGLLTPAAAGRRDKPGRRRSGRTPALMIQGTASNAGKSVLAAALCRILLQDGLRVAPFKAQNMSLNSFVTRAGGEMGRAQVVQAQACRLDPDVRMNPVLLKPAGDTGSQIIVNGRPVGNMQVADYIRYKPEAWRQVTAAYDALAAEHEVLVLEGAGSPAEVNLRQHDIVNMRMAGHAGAAVLLAGDIDRGGVFASFVGTLALLDEPERLLIKGFVVNRFRGQADLLADAYRYMERHTGLPVVGTVPFLKDLGLPEEDSVSFKAGLYDRVPPPKPSVEIAVLDLPYIANFTDIEPFLGEPDVHLRIVRRARELGRPDAVILPGSRNVVHDRNYLATSGLAGRLLELAAAGETEIIGICGGYQMLGRTIADPHGLEGSPGTELAGLGLLPAASVLRPEKRLARANGIHLASSRPVGGYEIHHGETDACAARPALRLAGPDRQHHPDGAVSANGRIWGTYLHGIFDGDPFRRWFIDTLRERAGLARLGRVVHAYDLEPALDRLAAAVRAALDMDAIRRLLGI